MDSTQKFNWSKVFTAPIFIICLLALIHCAAFAQQFGKNSVQYTNFDWHVIQSEHFDIYFYPGGETAASFVAEVAEMAQAGISESWDFELRDRIVILLYNSHNDFEQTNLNSGPPSESVGGFTEFYKNRVVIPYDGSYEKLRHVAHHELTHAMLLQMLFGTGHFSIINGITRANIPLWFIEGLAEYESRGGWDKESDMFIRDAVISGYIPPIRHLYALLAYKGGQAVLAYIAEQYGRAKIGEILAKLKKTKDIDSAIYASLGMTIGELSAHWHDYLRRKYWPEFADRAVPGDFAEQMTFHQLDRNFINNSGALSPQADKIAFLSDKSGYFDIYLISAITGEPIRKIINGQRTGRLEELHWLRPGISWNPQGTHVVFAAKNRAKDNLHIVDIATGKIVNSYEFDLDGVFSPAWSPRGLEIAFIGTKASASDIYIINTATHELTQLTSDIFTDLEPSWSPDGKQIAFTSDRNDNTAGPSQTLHQQILQSDYQQFDIFTITCETREIHRVTQTTANEKSPVWVPDGSGLAFVSDRNGISNIYIKRIARNSAPKNVVLASVLRRSFLDSTTVPAQLLWHETAYPITNVLTGVDHLSWQGQRLIFTSFNQGGFDIFGMTQPLLINPEQVELVPTSHVVQQIGQLVNEEMRKKDRLFEPDSTKASPYDGFVFGEQFKNGKALSQFALRKDLFLRPEDYLHENGTFKVTRYKTRFSPDIITANAGYDPFFGFQGATLLSFSDLMGNHRVNLMTDVFVDYKNSDFAASYQYRPCQTDYGAGIYVKNNLFFSEGRFLVRDRNMGLQLQMSRPLDKFHRLSYGLSYLYIHRDGLIDLADENKNLADRSVQVALASASYVKDNVLWGYTGPKAGTRFNATVQFSPKLGSSGLGFRIYKLDYRSYFNFTRHYTYAVRFSAGLSEGSNKQRFFMGGVPNWINLAFRQDVKLDLDDVYFSNFVTPVRGYDYYEQIGTKYFLSNHELRIPFVDYIQTRWPLPLRLANIRGALFVDLGSTWDGSFNLFSRKPNGGIKLDDLLMSFGWGARVNIGMFLIKYDMAWATDLSGVAGLRNLISIGTDF